MPQPELSFAKIRRRESRRTLTVIALVIAVVAAYQVLWRQHVKRLQVVRPGVLYRVAQPSELGIRYLVDRHQVKTILNLRLEDEPLRLGVLALKGTAGDVESHYAQELGIRSVQWPMGNETYFPWVTPWQYQEFFRLFDDPANWPVAVHCIHGKHRTGTIAALFRLEYDRWPIERVLTEMYSFGFGAPHLVQELNLRTFAPRPRPTHAEWAKLCATWAEVCPQNPPRDYVHLVHQLRTATDQAAVRHRLREQLERSGPFALCLAVQLLTENDVDDPCASLAAERAAACLEQAAASTSDVQSAAALVADFGTTDQQQRLLELLQAARDQKQVTPHFRALVAGIGSSYTPNRVPFLATLLGDQRIMPETGKAPVRFCDMAIAHLEVILDQPLISAPRQATADDWTQAREAAAAWLAAHPQSTRLSRLQSPSGHTVLQR